MWKAIYVCKITPRFCYPVAKILERNPVSEPQASPLCTDHDKPMTLARVEDLRSRVYTRKQTRRPKDRDRDTQKGLF